MKFLALIAAVLFINCSRPNNNNNTNSSVEISFDINGSRHSHNGAMDLTGVGVSGLKYPGNLAISTFYTFSANLNGTNFLQIIVPTPNDTLRVMTYKLVQGTGSQIVVNNEQYTFFQASDFLDISISSYSNGVVNGTFSGKLSRATTLNPLTLQQATITNGVIKNINLRY